MPLILVALGVFMVLGGVALITSTAPGLTIIHTGAGFVAVLGGIILFGLGLLLAGIKRKD